MSVLRMSMLSAHLLLVYFCSILVSGAPNNQCPIVNLDYGSFRGNTTGNLTLFLGIPFAQAPVGELRFAPPQPPKAVEGIQDATTYGPSCPQSTESTLNLTALGISNIDTSSSNISISEDCLSINVVKPSHIPDGIKLPVLFWIYGGAFEAGSSSINPGDSVVERSLALGEPVIYVSANYRLNAFGFLPGKEVLAAGITNIGIRDQRFALEWVHENIEKFGGDPSKVTIWGVSAGSASVALQLTLDNGDPKGLFRSAVMESGSIYNAKLDTLGTQASYDSIVEFTGCSSSSDTLECLRSVSMEELLSAVIQLRNGSAFSGLDLLWSPRIDGLLLKDEPVPLINQGLYAKVPIIIGDCDDEGTLFALAQTNITTNDEFLQFVKENYLPEISTEDLLAIGDAYPEDPSQGSPFDTGSLNALTPQYKRLAAFQGDLAFQAPRRLFLESVSKTQDTWSFLYKRGKATPYLGAWHSTDVPEFYGASTSSDFIGTDALINFANTLDPMVPPNPISLLTSSGITWEKWNSSTSSPPLLTFSDPAPEISIIADTYRKDAMDLLNKIAVELQGGE